MILSKMLRFFGGADTLICPPAEHETERLHGEVMQVIAEASILPYHVRHTADGTLVLLVARADTLRLRALPIASVLTLHKRHGLPELVLRYRQRIGIPIGTLLFCCLLFYFSQILWRVEVTGAVTVPAERIEGELAMLGWGAGAWLAGEDLYAVSDRLLALDRKLSYASVVRRGTVLYVHVREREDPPTQTEKAPANLVAKKDGFVVSYTVKEGQPMVSAGQAVRAGELLVSGVVLHRGGSLSVVCAEGAVYARTTCSATVEIPLVQIVEEDAGRVVYDRALKIFGWEINFFKSTGNIDIECDTITENRQVSLPFGIRLPIWQSVTYTVARRTQEQTHTPAEAVRLATSVAQARVRQEMGDAQVLTASTVVTQTANGYAVTYTVECLMDIATSREIGGGLEQG